MPTGSAPFRAVLLDWAGTTIDHGSRTPAQVFVDIFRQRGIDLTLAEARGPMGRAKRDHIALLSRLPRVAEAWREKFGRFPTENDIQAMYDDFLPLQQDALRHGSSVIPGVPAAIDALRRRGLKIGSTTGYTQELMKVVLPLAARGGYEPDVCVCSDEVPAGRPAPWMNLRAAERLDVYPLNSIVVVDDTAVGIAAGRNAGMWTVAVSRTGNALGLSLDEVSRLGPDDLAGRLRAIEQEFQDAGAHLVIESVADLPARLDELIVAAMP